MLKLSLCDYSDAYILAEGIMSVANYAAAVAVANNNAKQAASKNCAPFTDFISEINNTQVMLNILMQ